MVAGSPRVRLPHYQRLSDWWSAVNRVATLLLALDQVALLEREKRR